jgi:hypothetical protein
MILAVAALDLLVICLCPRPLIWGSMIPRISIVARPDGNGGYGCWYPLFSFKIPFPRRHVCAPLSFALLVPGLGRACSLAATFISPTRGASPLAIMFGSEMMLDCNRQLGCRRRNNRRGCSCFGWFGCFKGCACQLPRSGKSGPNSL